MKDKIKELLSSLIDDVMEYSLQEALNEECEITVKKGKGGVVETEISGSGMALLVTLAGLEKTILDKVGCTDSMFKIIKGAIGTKEAE